MSPTTEHTLETLQSPSSRDFLKTNGYIVLRDVASPMELQELHAGQAQACRTLLAAGKTQVFGVPLKFASRPSGERFITRLPCASVYSEAIASFVHSPRLRGLRSLVGAHAHLAERESMGTMVNDLSHQDGARSNIGWHTDGIKSLPSMPQQNLQMFLLLDDAPAEHGGVRVLPGTHTQGLWDIMFRKLYFASHAPDPDEVALSGRAGDLVIYDGRLWHRTTPGSVQGPASQRRQLHLKFLNSEPAPKPEDARVPLFVHFQGLDG